MSSRHGICRRTRPLSVSDAAKLLAKVAGADVQLAQNALENFLAAAQKTYFQNLAFFMDKKPLKRFISDGSAVCENLRKQKKH